MGNKLTKEETTGFCTPEFREDGKSVIFKKLEKVGESVTVKGRTFQKLTSDNYSCKGCVFNVPNKACCKNSYIEGICDDNGFWIEIKQNKEDMEENNNAKHSNSENIGKNLKPFDLQAAKSGKLVCTRDGKKARIICFDVKGSTYPIIALIEEGEDERLCSYMPNGRRYEDEEEWKDDLMMLPEKKEGWVNIYKGNNGISKYDCDDIVFNTKEEAIQYAQNDDKYITTVKIPWEE